MSLVTPLLRFLSTHFIEVMTIVLAFMLAAFVVSLPHTVILKESDWECTRAGTKGLDSQCLEYRHKL